MTRKETILNMKNRLKELAVKIRRAKPYSYMASIECRHLHMLYGVYRGLPMQAIEAKCRETLSEYRLKEIAIKYELGVNCDEVICYSRSVTV